MTKALLAGLVGGIIFFVWQSLSWMLLPIHLNSTKHTPNQDTIMSVLNNNLTEDGLYYLPSLDMSKKPTDKECEESYNNTVGKPYATISYHKVHPGMPPTQFVKGLVINILSCILVALLLLNMDLANMSMGKVVSYTMFTPVLIILQGTLTDANWWSTPFHFYIGTIIDLIVGWLLISLWFGFYLKRN